MIINDHIAGELDRYLESRLLVGLGFYSHLRRQLLEQQDLCDRRNMDGHVTCSLFLLNEQKTKALMIHHRAFDIWMPAGGHAEGATTLLEDAMREEHEETGYPLDAMLPLGDLGYPLLDLDTHAIPARPEKNEGDHWHHDFMYLALGDEDLELAAQLEEVHAAKWIPLEELTRSQDKRVARVSSRVLALIDAM